LLIRRRFRGIGVPVVATMELPLSASLPSSFPGVEPRDQRGLHDIALGLFLALLVWAPLPLGSNRPWSWSLLMAGVALVGLVLALHLLIRGERPRLPWPVGLAGLAFAGVAGWAYLQMQPVPVAAWVHPAWAALEFFGIEPLDGRGLGAVSLDVDLTRDALMRFLGYVGAFAIAFVLARDPDAAQRLLLVLLCTMTAVSAYGLFMLFGGSELLPFAANTAYRGVVTGTFVNRNNFATYANLGIIIGVVWLFEPFLRDLGKREIRVLLRELLEGLFAKRGIVLVALLVLASASLLTASRGGFLSIAAALLTLIVLLFLLTKPRPLALAIATPLVVGSIWGLVALSGGAVLERFEQGSDVRLEIWSVTGEMIEDRFWLGHGYGTYEPAFYAYRDERFRLVVDKAHNTYLEHAAELGVPATVLLYVGALLLFYACARGVFQRRRDKIFPLVATSASVLVAVHAVFDFSLQIPAVAVTYAAMMGVGCAQSIRSEKRQMRGNDFPAHGVIARGRLLSPVMVHHGIGRLGRSCRTGRVAVQQYVAFDVSKQSSEAVIVDEAGKRLVSRKVATDPSAMAAFVAKHGANVVSVGFEAGPLSTWLYHELTAAGLPVVCIDSWRARAAH
jgi:O-antigen ligase